MPSHVRPSLARSSAWNLVGQGLPLLIGLIAIPVTVRGLGLVGFGLLALCWTVVGYFNYFDLGFGRAVTKRVSEARGAADMARVGSVATAAAAAQLALGAVAAAALWLGAAPLARLIMEADAAVQAQAAQVLRLLALAVPAVLLSNSYRAVLEGLQRFDRVNLIRIPFSSANYLIPLVGALLGWQLSQMVAGLVLARYGAAASYMLAYRASGGWRRFTKADMRSLVRFGGWVALSNAIIPLTVTLERYVVSGLYGPEQFSYYSAPAEIVLRVLIVPSAFAVALFPLLSELFQLGRREEATAATLQAVRTIMLLLAPPLAAILLLAEPLLGLWLGADFAQASATVLRVLAIALFVNAVAYVPSAVTEAAGRPDLIARYHVVELPLYLLLLLLIVPRFGLVGAAGTVVIRMIVMTSVLSGLAVRSAALSLPRLAGGAARAAGASVALLAASWLAGTMLPLPLAAGGVLTAAFAGVVWVWVLSAAERQRLRARLLLRGGALPRAVE